MCTVSLASKIHQVHTVFLNNLIKVLKKLLKKFLEIKSKVIEVWSVSHKVDVLVVGHSFVRCIGQLCATAPEWDNLGLKRDRHTVSFLTRTAGGKSISTVMDVAGVLSVFCHGNQAPKVVLLDIGSYDLNNSASFEPKHLVELIMDVAARMLGSRVKRVAMVEMTFRKGVAAVCRDVKTGEALKDPGLVAEAESDFIRRVHKFNSLLKIKAEAAVGVDYIRLKVLTHGCKDHLQQDGVHLTEQALKIHARNHRSGAILSLQGARGNRGDSCRSASVDVRTLRRKSLGCCAWLHLHVSHPVYRQVLRRFRW